MISLSRRLPLGAPIFYKWELRAAKPLDACQVKDYCDKVARLLLLSDEQHERLLWAAVLHDIGKILDTSPSHVQTGCQIVAGLKLGNRLSELILRHHDPGSWATIELEILTTVDRFVNLFTCLLDKRLCLEQLRQDCAQGAASAKVTAALEQVL
ncbi:hypothetical protein AXX12_00965 [Anaerosporomusa subterranea]|uniref:HD domain-containing protein n=1 Tax=Anaerosporomusa subterranea TaxID=1794912 RepID=A0A154BW52_ANASB|nr:HD domain-containing protein [Anaerosporomusa subterranea]KYZ78147.1 hypothetical protein AXX12_00965 [Anaerosporomusa subterranea]